MWIVDKELTQACLNGSWSPQDSSEFFQCGDCWRSSDMHTNCQVWFCIYLCILVFTIVLIAEYLIKKRKLEAKIMTNFTWIFAFVLLWTSSLVLYYTDGFVNYQLELQTWLSSLTMIFTYLAVVVVIENILEIYWLFIHSQDIAYKKKIYRFVAALCVLTQIANPILARFEWYSEQPEKFWKHEHNPFFMARNMLTSIAAALLGSILLYASIKLYKTLKEHKSIKSNVRKRILALCIIIESALVLHLVLIWFQNKFFYATDKAWWICFLDTYQIFANLLPISAFTIVVIRQIQMMEKKIQKIHKRQNESKEPVFQSKELQQKPKTRKLKKVVFVSKSFSKNHARRENGRLVDMSRVQNFGRVFILKPKFQVIPEQDSIDEAGSFISARKSNSASETRRSVNTSQYEQFSDLGQKEDDKKVQDSEYQSMVIDYNQYKEPDQDHEIISCSDDSDGF